MASKNEQLKKSIVNENADREISMTRLINAPRELVFKVWTDEKHLSKWWGPEGFTTTTHERNVKPGGTWRFDMHGPDGIDYPNLVRYSEVIKNKLLKYSHGSGIENDPGEFEVTITFEAKGEKTLLTLRSIFKSAAARDYVVKEHHAIEGGNQTLNRLEQHLYTMDSKEPAPAKQVFSLTRSFDAPLDLVFKTFSEAEHLEKWWGPAGVEIQVIRFDFRPGGVFHFCMQFPGGGQSWAKFIYREIDRPNHIVFINSFADEEGNPIKPPFSDGWPERMLTIIDLEQKNNKTILHLRMSPLRATEEEYGVFGENFNSMQEGYAGTFDKLDVYLKNVEVNYA